MATVSAKVYEHHKKTDGTYNVTICVYHKEKESLLILPILLPASDVDLYQLEEIKAGQERLEYNRSKTCSQRKDHAFTSIKIIEEANLRLEKYAGRLQLSCSCH